MTIHELLAKFTPEQINFQMLSTCMMNCRIRKLGITEVSFGTDAITPTDIVADTGRVGMVVWIDREAWEAMRRRSTISSEMTQPREVAKGTNRNSIPMTRRAINLRIAFEECAATLDLDLSRTPTGLYASAITQTAWVCWQVARE